MASRLSFGRWLPRLAHCTSRRAFPTGERACRRAMSVVRKDQKIWGLQLGEGECMISIDKENIKFSSGHFTIFSATERERMHGHNFGVQAEFLGMPDKDGMMGDYGVLKRILRDICADLDEYFLLPGLSDNLCVDTSPEGYVTVFFGEEGEREHVCTIAEGDVKVLPVVNITVEELAGYLIESIKRDYQDKLMSMGVRAFSVSVSSGPGQTATRCLELSPAQDKQEKPGGEGKGRGGREDEAVRHVQGSEREGVVIVTGGSSGIGLETARKFSGAGYEVINISRKRCPLNYVTSLAMDLSDLGAIPAVAKELRSRVQGAPSVCVVHNAALYGSDTVQTLDPEFMERAMRIQTVAPAVLNRELIPAMPRGSSVLFIGSTLSEKAVSGCATYVTAKHALTGLMRATTQDLFGTGIHSVLLCPGFTDTAMLRSHVGDNQEILDSIAGMNSFDRLVNSEEIASLALFAAQNPALNGSVVHANLGQLER